MTPQDSLRLGERAQEVLDNPAFHSVAEKINADLLKEFKGGDDDTAMEARRKGKVMEDIINKLVRLVDKGRAAAKKLAESQEQPEEGDDT